MANSHRWNYKPYVRAARFGQALCMFGAVLGTVGLLGWLTGTMSLTRFVPGHPPMMPNTALALVLIGLAGALRYSPHASRKARLVSVLAAVIVYVIGVGTLAEYALGVDLRIDQLLVPSDAGPYPGRPSPPTGFALAALAVALLFADSRPKARARPTEWLALAAGLSALAALLGQLFGAGPLYRWTDTPVIGVALPTGLSLLAISVGLLLERPTAGVMAIATSTGPGGQQLRRLLLAVIAVPALLGLVVTEMLVAMQADDVPLVVAVLTACITTVGLVGLGITAVPLNRASRALERNRAQFRNLVDQASDGIFVADLDGHYTDVNQAGCRMLGMSREDILGKRITELIAPDEIPALFAVRDQLLKGHTHVAEWHLRHRDNHYVPVEVSTKILPDGRWQVFARDIGVTRKLQRQQELLARVGEILLAATPDYEATLGRLVESVVEDLADFAIVDLLEDGRMRRLEVACSDTSQRDRAEGLTKIHEQLNRDKLHLMFEPLAHQRSLLVTNVSSEFLATIAQSPEHLQLLERLNIHSLIAVPLLARGRLIGAFALLSSRPSRTYRDEDLRFTEQLGRIAALAIDNAMLYRTTQRAVAARDEVLGIVAHDLRNPLNAVHMQAQLLGRRSGQPERRSSTKFIDGIQRSVRRMDRLIQDMLDVARVESGTLGIDMERVECRALLDEVLDSHSHAAEQAQLRLRVDAADDLPDLACDRHRLLQVFDNLLGNAIKFTPAGGEITIGARDGGSQVLFWVADTGPGIPADQLDHLFNRFWQADRRDRRGAGLGLAIAKGIVDAHHGHIWAESEPGQGTSFWFTLPQAPLPARADQRVTTMH